MYRAKAPTVRQAMKMIFPAVEGIKPPDFNIKNHMLKQKPPKKHPNPSVTSANVTASPPAINPVTQAATKYAPWIPLETGVCMTYTMRIDTAKLKIYAVERKTCSHLVLIPMRV